MAYIPEGWVVFKIKDVYKVFGSWAGSYLRGDAWRINSGVESVEDAGDDLIINGYSGSEYVCVKNSYGNLTGYNSDVIKHFINDYNEQHTGKAKIFSTLDEFIEDYNSSLT